MAEYLHSVLVEEQDPAADAILTHELPVNPLSAILLHIKPLNETSTFTTYDPLSLILDAINNIRVTWRGVTLYEASGRDSRMLLLHRWGRDVIQNGMINTDDARRSVVLPILFGRFIGDPQEAIPQTRSGELEITLNVDVASAGYDDLRYGIETIELPEASPRALTRCTTKSQTFAGTGNNDIELDVGHLMRGLLLFQTTAFTGATPTPGLGRVEILQDGRQRYIMGSDVEVLRQVAALSTHNVARFQEHLHFADLDAGADADVEPEEQVETLLDNYVYIDLDLTRDDMYSLNTSAAKRLVLRSDAEVAEAMRALQVEQVGVQFLRQ